MDGLGLASRVPRFPMGSKKVSAGQVLGFRLPIWHCNGQSPDGEIP